MDDQTRTDSARTLSLQDDIERDQTLATVLYISGGVLSVAGLTLVYYTLTDTEAPQAGEGVGLRVNPFVGSGMVGVTVGGDLQ